MGKRKITLVSLSVALDREMVLQEFEQLCIPEIRKVCSFQGDKYAPSVWVDKIEIKEMEIETP